MTDMLMGFNWVRGTVTYRFTYSVGFDSDPWHAANVRAGRHRGMTKNVEMYLEYVNQQIRHSGDDRFTVFETAPKWCCTGGSNSRESSHDRIPKPDRLRVSGRPPFPSYEISSRDAWPAASPPQRRPPLHQPSPFCEERLPRACGAAHEFRWRRHFAAAHKLPQRSAAGPRFWLRLDDAVKRVGQHRRVVDDFITGIAQQLFVDVQRF